MARTSASTAKRRKSLAGATPTGQSTQADSVQESTPAANAVGCCLDLLTEILLHLPAKSLIRFKCVSKNWLSLISDFQFACNHSRRNPRPTPSGLFFYGGTLDMELESVSFYSDQNLPPLPMVDAFRPIEELTKIADSCNGLVLFENIGRDDECDDLVARYAVCNVSTQKYRVLPKPEGNAYRWYHTAFLAFDPSKSPHYKVVLVSFRCPPPYEIDVFSSQTGRWNKVFGQHTCYDGLGAYWNGAIHWVDDENCFRFDVDAEEMIATPTCQLPRILSPDKIRYLGECGGKLFLIQTRSRNVLGFTILKFYNHGRWCGSYKVNLRPLISEFPDIETAFEFDVLSLFCVGDIKKKEDFTLVLAIPRRIIAYNLHSKMYDKLFDLPEGFSIRRYRNGYAYPFIETLCPV